MKKYYFAYIIGSILISTAFSSCTADENINPDIKKEETTTATSTNTTETEAMTSIEITSDETVTESLNTSVSESTVSSCNNDNIVVTTEKKNDVIDQSHADEFQGNNQNPVQNDNAQEYTVTEAIIITETEHIQNPVQTEAPVSDIKINENGELELPEVQF